MEDEEGSLVGWKAIVVKEGGIRKDDQDRYLEDGLETLLNVVSIAAFGWWTTPGLSARPTPVPT